jgi:3-oxoacyl-[acyl-carrier protein] reductase
MHLEGKKALVTGGTRGIGRAIVTQLAAAGAEVVACSRHEDEAAQSLIREIKVTGGTHHVVQADVTRGEDIDRLVELTRDVFGSLDIVVHNAGAISHRPFGELDWAEWQHVLDANLGAAVRLTQGVLPMLSRGASITYIGSRAATIGVPLRAHYTAAKAGLIGLSRSLARELGPRGVRVNVVAPGPVDTGEPMAPEVRQRYERLIPAGRLGQPAEIAAVVVFVASDQASLINGETINVDGGI